MKNPLKAFNVWKGQKKNAQEKKEKRRRTRQINLLREIVVCLYPSLERQCVRADHFSIPEFALHAQILYFEILFGNFVLSQISILGQVKDATEHRLNLTTNKTNWKK